MTGEECNYLASASAREALFLVAYVCLFCNFVRNHVCLVATSRESRETFTIDRSTMALESRQLVNSPGGSTLQWNVERGFLCLTLLVRMVKTK